MFDALHDRTKNGRQETETEDEGEADEGYYLKRLDMFK